MAPRPQFSCEFFLPGLHSGEDLFLAVLTTTLSALAPGAHRQEGDPLWQPTAPVLRYQERAGGSPELY